MNHRFYGVLFVCVMFLFSYCSGDKEKTPQVKASAPDIKTISIFSADSVKIIDVIAEIADTQYERAQGLMNRKKLAANQGMLFIFEKENMQAFWMKNTPISLDIIFLNADMRIVHIAWETEPFSLRSISSVYPAMYVLEVVGGFCDIYDIQPGCRIVIAED
ncbi:MAG: DUF192 domain-containing protein [Calditrichaceae bacterium]|nr:DUF192 domain-containing protein [Calditrichaceae bacterium]RQV97006.1 MAG: DUF192 domain-containing protein [Calditrichota bacterium]